MDWKIFARLTKYYVLACCVLCCFLLPNDPLPSWTSNIASFSTYQYPKSGLGYVSASSSYHEEDLDATAQSGKEVIERDHPPLPDNIVDVSILPARKIALMQFDSRPLKNYWLSAAQWNHAYCQRHGHVFIYYSLEDNNCHHGDEPLASAWCKVRAMLQANEDFPEVDMFIYMDSDAVIDKRFAQYPLNQMIRVMQHELAWNPEVKPIVFNQDGPCWWCTFIVKIGYKMCLNAGTVAWYRHPTSLMILQQWWDASMDSYETNPIKRKFRLKWPWEQDRQMAIYNRSSEFIQIASQPDRIYMQAYRGFNGGWCLSHLPEAGCFISHYCANAHSKQVMRKLYNVKPKKEKGGKRDKGTEDIGFSIRHLHF